jgi:iron complex outermembrane receptor protein
MSNRYVPIAFFLCFFLFSNAQVDSSSGATHLLSFSLEELMNIPIYSVSKTEESSFDAPLSSTVVTREEIRKAGCTTIMEALRLVPGVIVRQQTNGNYTIDIRGLDNVPPNLSAYFFANSTTLVMIDDRPVYNYLQGGTFWETLPVDLNDVEKIEVVRGPAAAMYGPNAESGVINIITRKPEKNGLYAVGNAQYGNYNTAVANASVGYNFNNKISFILSGNFQNRDRTQSDYYDGATGKFIPLDSFVTNSALRNAEYPHPNLSMRKYGYNAFLNFNINKNASISLQGGGQNSLVQDIFGDEYLTTALATSYYGNMKAQAYGVNLQTSFLAGTQQPQAGNTPGKYNFNSTDITLDYRMTKVKHLVITPGGSYRLTTYNDGPYADVAIRNGAFNGKVQSYTASAFLRADYTTFGDKLRLVAAARMDKFNYPAKVYFSWNFAATYKITKKHLLRIAESRANRTPLFLETFYNLSVPFSSPTYGPGTIQLLGNHNLNLLTTDMLEFGYRGKLKDNLEIDLEVFGSNTKNYSNEILTSIDSNASGTNYLFYFQNLPLVAREIGATVSLNYAIEKVQLKPYFTVQHTTLYNYSPYVVEPYVPTSIISPAPTVININSGLGTQMAQADNLTYNDGVRGVENIPPQFIMNVVVGYTFFKKLTVFANFKNCFDEQTREFYRGDIIPFQVSGGVNFNY